MSSVFLFCSIPPELRLWEENLHFKCNYYANIMLISDIDKVWHNVWSCYSCKGEAITILARSCASLKYNDLGFAFGSCMVFLCSTVKWVRLQISCFWVFWPVRVLRRHHFIQVYKAIMQHCWVGQKGVRWQAYKQSSLSPCCREGIVACNMRTWRSIWGKGLFLCFANF